MSAPVNNSDQTAPVNTAAQQTRVARVAGAKSAALAANTLYSISDLLDLIVAKPTGFFTIVEKEPPKNGKPAPARTGAGASVKYYKQQWDFGNGTKFTGNLKFNLVGNAPAPETIPESAYPDAREDILAGHVRMYRGIANPDDERDHRNNYESGDGKGSGNKFKVSISSAEAGKLGQFMILLDKQWEAECERLKAANPVLKNKAINLLTSSFISEGENAGKQKDAPTFGIKIPVNEVYPANYKSRAGQPKSVILDASTLYKNQAGLNRFLVATVETDEGTVTVDGTNAWQFVEPGSKFISESEFEFGDPNCSGFGFAMPLIATTAVIERRAGSLSAPVSSIIGSEDEYLASINGNYAQTTTMQPARAPPAAASTVQTRVQPAPTAQPTAAAPPTADDKAMLDLLNEFQ